MNSIGPSAVEQRDRIVAGFAFLVYRLANNVKLTEKNNWKA